VLFSVLTLSQSSFGKRHHELVAILQINPAAVYITLMRNALLLSQRLSAPGAKPENARICATWPGTAKHPHYYASAYCHAVINPDHLWYYAVGWAVFASIIGFFFFWRAEAKYGRG
jgi:hypothetical protein